MGSLISMHACALIYIALVKSINIFQRGEKKQNTFLFGHMFRFKANAAGENVIKILVLAVVCKAFDEHRNFNM